MKSSKKRNPSENSIQNAILTYLSYRSDVFAWRNNTVGVYDQKAGRYRASGKYSIKGVADILGICNDGRFLAIEVKKLGGRTSSDQQNFISRIERLGGIAAIVTTVEEVIKLLDKERHDEIET